MALVTSVVSGDILAKKDPISKLPGDRGRYRNQALVLVLDVIG